jgi:hypothetical protein
MIIVNVSERLGLVTTSSGGTGTFSTVIQASGVTGTTDWADYKSLYQEARVVGVEALFIPKFEGAIAASSAALTFGVGQAQLVDPLFFCPFHGDATALSSIDSVVNHQARMQKSINRTLRVSAKMKETDEAQWFSTTSGTTGLFGIKTWFQSTTVGASDAVSWGNIIVTYAVQFRGRVVSATQVRTRPAEGADQKSSALPALQPLLAKGESWFEVNEAEVRAELLARRAKAPALGTASLSLAAGVVAGTPPRLPPK